MKDQELQPEKILISDNPIFPILLVIRDDVMLSKLSLVVGVF